MRRRLALLIVLSAPFSGLAVTASAPAATPLAAARTCSSGYVHADLSWGEKCLRAGQFCKVGSREYVKYGFYCPPSGHLRRR